MDVLVLRDNAKQQLQQIKDVETGIDYLNKVRAVEVWARAEKKDAELQNMIAEQKIRTQRILGQLIKEGQQRGEIARPEQPVKINVPDGYIKPKTLSDIGITRKESSTFQTIASIPEDKFENFIEEKKQKIDDAVFELTTAGIVAFAKGKPIVGLFTGNNEWYTPSEYIELARKTMGDIDLDPASSEEAQKIVKAKNYFTIEINGLSKEWKGNIWLNPPYSGKEIILFIDKLINEYRIGNIKQAIILTNDNTDTTWFHKLAKISSAICFLRGRVKFYNENNKSAPTNGQLFYYVGENMDIFNANFKNIGLIMVKYE